MGQTRECAQYQVEAQKRGRRFKLDLLVSVTRGPRGKRKLMGEALTRDAESPAIYFKVSSGDSEEEVFASFLRLLVHRGYLPVAYRQQPNPDARWDEWRPPSLDGLDLKKVMENEERSM